MILLQLLEDTFALRRLSAKFAQADRGSGSDEGRRASDACATINEAFEFESRNGKEEDHERTNQSIRREGSRRTAAS